LRSREHRIGKVLASIRHFRSIGRAAILAKLSSPQDFLSKIQALSRIDAHIPSTWHAACNSKVERNKCSIQTKLFIYYLLGETP
jgi:hypothetical protein